LAHSRDERWFATTGASSSASNDRVVKVWSSAGPRTALDRADADDDDDIRGDETAPFFSKHEHREDDVTCVAFLPCFSGISLAASGDSGGRVRVWRVDTGALVTELREPSTTFRSRGVWNAGVAFEGTFARSSESAFGRGGVRSSGSGRDAAPGALPPRGGGGGAEEAEAEEDRYDDDRYDRYRYDDDDKYDDDRYDRYRYDDDDRYEDDRYDDRYDDDRYEDDRYEDDRYDDRSAAAAARVSALARLGFSGSRFAGPAVSTGTSPRDARARSQSPRSRWRAPRTNPSGYSCLSVAPASAGTSCDLVLGTTDGRLRLADVRGERFVGSWACASSSESAARAPAVSSVCFPGVFLDDADDGYGSGYGSGSGVGLGVACLGLSDGSACFLDRRGGRALSKFKAHDDAVSAVFSRSAARGGGYHLVTASKDATVRVWDTRALSFSNGSVAGRRLETNSPLVSFVGFGGGVRAAAVHGARAFVAAGEKVAVFSLDADVDTDVDTDWDTDWDTASASSGVRVTVAPRRLRAVNGAAVRTAVTGIAVLPRSRLLIAAGEDGKVRACG